MAGAISAGFLTRPRGHARYGPFQAFGSPAAAWMPVRTIPGATALTRIPCPARSLARLMVSASTPAFTAAWWTHSCAAPRVAPRRGRGDVDDRSARSAAGCGHHLGGAADSQQHPGQVDLDHPADYLDRGVREVTDMCGQTGVVHQPGHRPERDGSREQRVNGVRVGDITRHGECAPPPTWQQPRRVRPPRGAGGSRAPPRAPGPPGAGRRQPDAPSAAAITVTGRGEDVMRRSSSTWPSRRSDSEATVTTWPHQGPTDPGPPVERPAGHPGEGSADDPTRDSPLAAAEGPPVPMTPLLAPATLSGCHRVTLAPAHRPTARLRIDDRSREHRGVPSGVPQLGRLPLPVLRHHRCGAGVQREDAFTAGLGGGPQRAPAQLARPVSCLRGFLTAMPRGERCTPFEDRTSVDAPGGAAGSPAGGLPASRSVFRKCSAPTAQPCLDRPTPRAEPRNVHFRSARPSQSTHPVRPRSTVDPRVRGSSPWARTAPDQALR